MLFYRTYPFMIKVSDLLTEDEVLQQGGATRTCSQAVLVSSSSNLARNSEVGDAPASCLAWRLLGSAKGQAAEARPRRPRRERA